MQDGESLEEAKARLRHDAEEIKEKGSKRK